MLHQVPTAKQFVSEISNLRTRASMLIGGLRPDSLQEKVQEQLSAERNDTAAASRFVHDGGTGMEIPYCFEHVRSQPASVLAN